MVEKFEDLAGWKCGIELSVYVYNLTSSGNLAKDFGLKNQLQRASVSIILNIAEGFDSGTPNSFLTFLRYSYRSSSEVKAIMLLSKRLNYIKDAEFQKVLSMIDELQKIIGGLITSQKLQIKKRKKNS